MATTIIDQITGTPQTITHDLLTGRSETVAYKAPCRVATTANMVLNGLQTIDSALLADGDAVLVKDQTDARQNGIYFASTGPWQRSPDFDSIRDVTKGTRVTVTDGGQGGKEYQVTSEAPINIGSDAVLFVETLSSDAGSSAAAAAASAAQASDFRDAAQTARTGAEAARSVSESAASAASGSASAAQGSATSASDSATAAAGSASASAGSASASAGSATSAGNAKTGAETAQSAAVAAKALAEKWANEDEDVEVEPGEYSAKHWAAKSQESASDVTSVNGKTGTVVLDAADVGAATAGQGAKADTAVQPGALGDAATRNVGTSVGTVAAGDDGRIVGAVQTSRQVATQHSLAGGGDLAADRALSLAGDTASPGNNKVYGTDGSGTRGWQDAPTPDYGAGTAALTAGGIGTYVFAGWSPGSNVTLGATVAGSSLTPAGVTGSGGFNTVGSALSGTWRLMGGTNSGSRASLFVRIS